MHPGVGFTVHYSTLNYDGLPYAYYFHNSPWWDTWTPDSLVAPKTLYGSSGCINLPDDRYKTFDVLGKQVSFAELFFRWASSSLKCSNTETGIANADAARMDVNDWYAPSKDCPIPVYSIATIDSLDAFVPYAAQIQTQYASFVAAAHP